ncbi:DUF547 domain-containing protein, partial [Xanthovirga aplysinae]|uniref:DUF547 domain-containing protein n=1 Tax=Xanthovirga aplysinae TaxID=2529853 RepID=UPI0012BB493F
LEKQLPDDTHKKAFWINTYNSFFQILRKYNNLKKPKIFSEKYITIAGQKFSLDDIEHGILRRFRYKYSLGYLSNPFTSSLIKKWAVNFIDYRIHFALNCGAKSCPPIAFYSVGQLEQQLEFAALSFIEGDTEIIDHKKEVHISKLFKWFLKDFGGTKGVRKIINQQLGKDFSAYKLIYKDYSWEEQLDNYAERNLITEVS